MKFTRLKGAKSIDGTEVTLRFVDKLNRERELTLPRDLAFQLTLVIRQSLKWEPSAVHDLRKSLVYELAGAQQLAAEGGVRGLVLVTREGFQIPVALDESGKALLRHAIDGLDQPAPPHSLSQH